MMFVSATRSKIVGDDAFLVAKVQFFRIGAKTHHNITIFTMCKIPMQMRIKLLIWNVCIYYSDEIIVTVKKTFPPLHALICKILISILEKKTLN